MAGQFDPASATLAPGQFDPSTAALEQPAPPRGALGEIGTGVERGALVGLPTMAGKALQYASEPGRPMYRFGQGMVSNAEARGQQPGLTLQPEQHGAFVNALASGGEMLAPGAAVPLALGGLAAAAGASPLLATGAAAVGAGALFGAQSGQETLEKAKKAGLPDATAREAARLNAATTMATQTGMGMIGGQLLGTVGRTMMPFFKQEGASLTAQTLGELTGTSGVMAPLAKQLPGIAAEAVGVNAGQAALSAQIERSYGVDNTSPGEAAAASVAPTLGMTALMGPLALVGRAMNVRAAKTRTEALAHPDTPAEIRTQLAQVYADRLAGSDPQAATNFLANAKQAIADEAPLPVDSRLLSPDFVQPKQPEPQALQLTNSPSPMVVFPDGTVGRSQTEVDNYLAGLPEGERAAARARLLGLGEQPAEPLTTSPGAAAPGEAAAAPAVTAPNLTTSPGAAAPRASGVDFTRDIDTSGLSLQDPNAPQLGYSKGTPTLFTFPDGTTTSDPGLAEQYIQGLPPEQQVSARGRLFGFSTDASPQATPRTRDAIIADWKSAMAANDMDTKAQSLVPFVKRLDAMGIDKLATPQEQAAALQSIVDDKKVSQNQRDRASMLLDQWKKDLPQEKPSTPTEEKPSEVPPAAEATKPAEPVAPVLNGQPANAAEAAVNDTLNGKPPLTSQAVLGTEPNIETKPAETPAIAGQPAANAAVLGENIPLVQRNMPVTDLAEAAADKVAELRAGFTDRIRGGEKLSPLEQERYEDLNSMAQALQPYLEGAAKPRDAEWVKSIAQMVDQASNPYKKSLRADRVVDFKVSPDGPEVEDPALLAPAMMSHKASDVVGNIATNSKTPWMRELASKIEPLMGDTSIFNAGRGEQVSTTVGGQTFTGERVGGYNGRTDSIDINSPTEASIMHEATHAVTMGRLERAADIAQRGAKNQDEAQLLKAYKDLQGTFDAAKADPNWAAQYGMKNLHEFVAEAHTNAEFRDFLQAQRAGQPQTLWQRFVSGVRRLLGMQPKDETLLDRALGNSEPFFSSERWNHVYDSSPEGATRATDATLQRVLRQADADTLRENLMGANLKVLRGVLPWQTLTYIADRARAIPELVRSGFTTGLDAHRTASASHEVLMTRLQDVGSKYTGGLDKTLRVLGGVKSREVQAEMAHIGGEASRVGFDYRLSGKDNLAKDPSIAPEMKAYMDDIHRRFTQLQASNPEAAKALEEGEKINRRRLVETMATVSTNMMDDAAGRARRLEADILRLPPGDARRAEMENRVKVLTTDSLMASKHAKGLDLMDASLANAKNPDASRWHDGATAELANRLHAAFAEARTLPDGSWLKGAMRDLEGVYAKESAHPYFSLGRDGGYFVKVGFKDMDTATNARIQKALEGTGKVLGDLTKTGDQSAFFRVDSAHEAQALHDKLLQAGQGKVVNTAWNKIADKVQDAASTNPAIRSLLSRVDDMQFNTLSPEQAGLVKQTLTRQMLSMLPETSSRSAKMMRQGVAGYDADFLTHFAKRDLGATHDIAGLYTSRAYMAAADVRKQALDQLSRTGSPDARQRAQLIDDELGKRYAGMMQPAGLPGLTTLTSLSHSFYLGLSPAFFIRTSAQPWHRGLPYLGSKFGYGSSMAEIGRAQATALKLVANSVAESIKQDGVRGMIGAPVLLKDLNLAPREMAFMQEAHANGKFDLGESGTLARLATSEGSRKLADATRMASATAQYAEMSNRVAMGLAAFRLASKRPELMPKGMTAEKYALLAMEMTMDDFSPSNTARAIGKHGIAGQITPLFSQFQNYNFQTMQQIARTVHDGFFGQDKSPEGVQRAKEARSEFAGLMATTGVIAGALGLPFANTFAGLYNTFTQDKDNPQDVRVALRRWADTTFGPQVGAMLMRGVPTLANMDTSTMGLQGIMPGSDFLADRTLWKDRSETAVRNSLGPVVSLGLDLPEAVSKMVDGYWVKGIEAALPVGLRTFYKTAEMAMGPGYYTDSKNNPTPMKVGAGDIAWRALGFQTAEKADQSEIQRDFMINQERLKNRRQIIGDNFYKAATRSPEDMPDALAAVSGFNAKNPYQPIRGEELASAVAGPVTRNALGAALGLGFGTTRRQLPVLQHSAMPDR